MKLYFLCCIVLLSCIDISNAYATVTKPTHLPPPTPLQPPTTSPSPQTNDDQNGNFTLVIEIIAAVKQQHWLKDEQECLDQTMRMLEGVRNYTLWATWAYESMNIQPVGQLFGSRHHLGNFDECMDMPWAEQHPGLQTQYCLADVQLEVGPRRKINGTVNPYWSTKEFMTQRIRYFRPVDSFVWGLCLPASCSAASAQKFASAILETSQYALRGVRVNLTIDNCQKPGETAEYWSDWPFLGFMAFTSSLMMVSLVCTWHSVTRGHDPDSYKSYIIRAFCMVTNSKSLLRRSEDGLRVLYGVRFLSIMLVVLGHQILYSNISPISNGWTADKEVDSALAFLFIHDDLVVDTFFWMSGLLIMRTFLYFKRLPNVFAVIIKRYIRLAPGLAVVLWYICSALKYTGSGPLWPSYTRMEAGYCQKNWWTNMLMVNNFVDTANMCYLNTWYIPNDFQMFLIAVVLFWICCLCKMAGKLLLVAVTIASVVTPATITYYYNLTPLQLMSFDEQQMSRKGGQLEVFYIKVYNRFGAYLVGLATGYIFATFKPTVEKNRVSKTTAISGAASGLVLMLAVLLSGAKLHRDGWGAVEAALYAALNRPAWCLGLALVVLSCAYGSVPIITPFLSWSPWVPLGRLAFGVYLVHGLIIYRNTYVTRNLLQLDKPTIVSSQVLTVAYLGVTVMSLFISYHLWLLVEAPVNNLFMLAFIPRHLLKKIEARELTEEDINPKANGITKNKQSMTDTVPDKQV
ncbi:hypothetical protein JYU34_018781 [Plutella xylostella]|uniref:Nose resistant-to-fluoxetine protein N-terminal domain-containing protein n=1 Tax=Plutella xylostella TaxID=51655 RepID=A0ABQ7PZX1_PLUXY|nr:hypothetical protein JYU34_018781 [Plutella xylostella]